MVTPEIIMGISLLIFFCQLFGPNGSIGQISLAHITFCISYVAVVGPGAGGRAWTRGWRRPPATSARRRCGAFRHVTLPLIAPAVAAGAMLAFALSFDDLVVTSFNAGVGSTTLPIFIYSSIKFGVTPADQRDLDDHRRGRLDRPVHRVAVRARSVGRDTRVVDEDVPATG